MSAVNAVWKGGQVVLETAVDWPEGSTLVVTTNPAAIKFMTEEEQGDDPASIERWIEELRSLEGLSMTAEEEADLSAWRQKVKVFNLEAVRRQMEEGIP